MRANRLLSVKELSEELGVSEDTIRRAYWKGEIPGFRICTVLRFRPRLYWLGRIRPADAREVVQRDPGAPAGSASSR